MLRPILSILAVVFESHSALRYGSIRKLIFTQFAAAAVLFWAAAAPAAAGEAGSAAPRAHAAKQPLVRMTVTRGRPNRRLRRSFVGFSTEYKSQGNLTGDQEKGPNLAALGLFENFTRNGSGPPVLRLGGNSADEIWWNPTGRRPQPLGIHFDLKWSGLLGLKNFLTRSGSPALLSLNLASPDPTIARDLMLAVLNVVGASRIKAFLLGNEPNHYPDRSFGRDSTGRSIPVRPRGYDFNDYLRDFRRRAKVLRRAWPNVRLAGPSSESPAYQLGLSKFLKRERRYVKFATFHNYPGTYCGGFRRTRGITVRKLLASQTLLEPARTFQFLARVARQYRRSVRLTEVNTATCGGTPGVSDRFASALWAVDYLLEMAAVGVRGVDLHTYPGAAYAPFQFGYSKALGWRASVAPLYYGLLLFSQATANRARLLTLSSFQAFRRRGANVDPWATIDRQGTVRVLVVNKDLRASGRAVIRVPRGRGAGTLIRLLAPSARAKTGVTLAGQSVPALSADGALRGPYTSKTVRRGRRGVYRFFVPRASAALLTVPTR